MVKTKDAERMVSEAILTETRNLGFRRGSNFMLFRECSDELLWQLRFGARVDASTRSLLVSMSAGVRFESVEHFRDRTFAENDKLPTFGAPIHFLHPDRKLVEWDAEEPASIPAIIHELRINVFPFFNEYGNLTKILNVLQSDDPRNWLAVSRNERPELMAAVLSALGRFNEARNVLEDAIKVRLDKPSGHRFVYEKMLRLLDSKM